MGHLLLADFKSVKKILFIYYAIILFSTLFIYPIAGWVALLFIIRIERDVCKENVLMGLPTFYKNFPQKYLYADEKNVFFYLVIGIAIIIWGGACFIVEISEFPGVNEKVRLIIGLGMIGMIICGIYHISWFHFFFKYFDTKKCIQEASKYYIAFAVFFTLLTKNSYIYEKIGIVLEFKSITCLVLSTVNLCIVFIAFIYARKSYGKSEVN